MKGLDCSMIRHVRVPHEQFVAIRDKAKYLIVEDRDKGECVHFDRAKEVSGEEVEREIKELVEVLNELRKSTGENKKLMASLNTKITKCIQEKDMEV